MPSNYTAEQADQKQRYQHRVSAKYYKLRKLADNRTHQPKSGQYQDVNLRMPKKSEQVLEEQQIATPQRIKEGGVEVSIADYHGYAGGQHGDGDDEQQASEEDRPAEQLYVAKQVQQTESGNGEDAADEVDAPEQRRQARHMERKEQQVDTGVVHLGQRHIEGPACIHAAIYQQAQDNQYQGEEGQPQRQQVQAREDHVVAPYRNWDHQVPEAADQNGHNHEEDH